MKVMQIIGVLLLVILLFVAGFVSGIVISFQDTLSWYDDEVLLINDEFDSYDYAWSKWMIGDADYELLEDNGINFLRLRANSGIEGQVVLAQLDDYSYRSRPDYRWYPGTSVVARMRYSHNDFSGTGGFYLWNNPIPLGASSFTEYRGLVWTGFQMISPTGTLNFGNGNFIRRGTVTNHTVLDLVAMSANLSSLGADEVDLTDFDMTQWHDYRIDWYPDHIVLSIDDEVVLESQARIEQALAPVLWVDNTEVMVDQDGQFGVSYNRFDSPVWLDVDYIRSEFLE